MDFRVQYNGEFFVCSTSGDATADAFEEFLDALLAHADWKPGSHSLIDHSKLNSGPLTVDEIQRIAQFCSDRRDLVGSGKCAIVVERNLEYGLARMWGEFVHGRWDAVAEVFRSQEEAKIWLSA